MNKEQIKLLNKYGWDVTCKSPLEIMKRGAHGVAHGAAVEVILEYYESIDDVTTNKLPKWKPGTEEGLNEELNKGHLTIDFSKIDTSSKERFAAMIRHWKDGGGLVVEPPPKLAEEAVFSHSEVNSIVNYLWRKSDRGFNNDMNLVLGKFNHYRKFIDERAFDKKEWLRRALLEMTFTVSKRKR